MREQPQFQPLSGASTTNVTVTAASAALDSVAIPANVAPAVIRLFNSGTVVVFVNFGTGAAVATSHMPIAPMQSIYVRAGNGVNNFTVIAAGAGSTLYCTPGMGGLGAS